MASASEGVSGVTASGRPVDSRPVRRRFAARFGQLRWRRLLLGFVLATILVGVVAPLRQAAANVASRALLFAASPLAPDISGFEALPETTRVVASDGSVLAELDGGQRRQLVSLHGLPPFVPRAVLAAEDADFYQHSGVDPAAVARAVVRNAQGQRQGASTITQQLAKLNYAGSQRTWMRKLKEVLYASKLEQRYSKDQLLERYLNQVYFGQGAYGLGAAANAFFGIPPERLSAAQAATLAGKIRSPSALDPRTDPQGVLRRRDQVLRNMRNHAWLNDAELTEALATPLQLGTARPVSTAPVRAPHFVSYVEREAMTLDALGGTSEARGKRLYTGGLTIRTTLDRRAFDATVASVRANLSSPGDPTTAVASIQPGDGALRILFGGLDTTRSFDVASQGRRQPGSSFKPFVYLAALEAGIDPRSRLDASSPVELTYQGKPFRVENYEGEGGGRSSINEAMIHSLNTVYAQLGILVGPDKVVRAAEMAGVHHGIAPVPAVSLGGLDQGVSPLEMAAAYATFASGGVYASPYSISAITDRNGRTIYDHQPETRQAFDPREVGILNATLMRVVDEGTGSAASLDRPVAGKTGTSENYTNAWFVGYTPQLSTAVWVGQPQGDVPMTNVHGRTVTGGSFPASIFGNLMARVLSETDRARLPTAEPDALDLHTISPASPPLTDVPLSGPPSPRRSWDRPGSGPGSTPASSRVSSSTSVPRRSASPATSPPAPPRPPARQQTPGSARVGQHPSPAPAPTQSRHRGN